MQYTGVNIAIDFEGNIIISGTTESSDFPTTHNSFCNEFNGISDIFVAKFSGDLNRLLSCTLIGGNAKEEVRGLIVDETGNIYICGITESEDFPTTENGYINKYQGGSDHPYGSGDVFITKIDNDLEYLLGSTFMGGSSHECCSSLDIDQFGNIFITGATNSNDFPITDDAYDKDFNPGGYFGCDIFISKFSNDLSQLIGSTYLGGSSDDYSEQLILDDDGNVYISGWVASSDFPTTMNAYDRYFNHGYYDAFISKFDNSLSSFLASTYVGGRNWDFSYGMTLGDNNEIFITGHTASTDFPVSADAFCNEYQGIGGASIGDDSFISRFNQDLSSLISSTYLGGSDWENGYTIIQDYQENIIVSGTTSSSDYPITDDVFCDTYNGGSRNSGDVFITKLNKNLELVLASSFLGKNNDEGMGQIIFDDDGHILIAGATGSSNFPVSLYAYDYEYNGGGADVFVVKIDNQFTSQNVPLKPLKPIGSAYGKTGNAYTYSTMTFDLYDDNLFYLFEWGDGNSDLVGPYESGEVVSALHIWSEEGTYEIKVKARDVNGFESEWSDPLPVTMPKNKLLYRFPMLLNLLDQHHRLLPLLRLILKI